ncbi:MAG: pyridoxamine 5'-phosphate oxidase family protein [Gemmatimonadota bacterium]|nr:pyridoxamine 5'-phosphate oxidase family protein [Gemmatimonadota bacterium]MDH3422186.1 pyridoxamine 5'-phosphate oxidase family protein [Gemmatimonadota bacterium]
MGDVLPELTDRLRDFIGSQSVFFVASAPLAADGHVNLSPKGLDTFRILDDKRVAYLDLTGSGNETSAHMSDNGRITLMFCAFDGPPTILRLFGRGRVVLPDTPEWEELIPSFEEMLGARQLIVAEIHRIQKSCGYAVPRLGGAEERDQLTRWAEAKGEDGLHAYRLEKNTRSIDGIAVEVAGSPQTD